MLQNDAVTQRRFLTTSEAAGILACSPRTVHRLAASGTLPFEEKLPGATGEYLFNPSTVEMLARDRRRSTEAAS